MALTKHIPNAITSMNLLSGVLGVILTLEGRLEWALPLMILAAVFDFCDGLAARLLNAYSPIGKGGPGEFRRPPGHHAIQGPAAGSPCDPAVPAPVRGRDVGPAPGQVQCRRAPDTGLPGTAHAFLRDGVRLPGLFPVHAGRRSRRCGSLAPGCHRGHPGPPVLLKQNWSLAILAVFSVYIVENLLVAVINSCRRGA